MNQIYKKLLRHVLKISVQTKTLSKHPTCEKALKHLLYVLKIDNSKISHQLYKQFILRQGASLTVLQPRVLQSLTD